jgi:hypothetical protein
VLEIRPAQASECEEVARFLHCNFKAKIPLERWRNLIDGRWSRPSDGYGISLLDGTDLVGFLGMVHAERPVGDGLARMGNMTSWYLKKPYRGRGLALEMLQLATADPEVTVTNFSSVPHAVRLLEKAGLGPLDDRRLIWRAGATFDGPAARLIPEPQAVPGLLSDEDATILRDHRGLNLKTIAVETPESDCCLLVLTAKKKHDDYVTHEVLHLGNPAVFARHAPAIAHAVLPPSGAVLSVDWRFLGAEAGADAVEQISVPRFFTPGRMAPNAVDFLYSETVLLDLKLR